MEDKYIVMKVSDLHRLLNDIKRYKHYYIYASDQNRDGQGEWHCDIEVGNEPLDENGWGDGEEHWSFDSFENHMAKFVENHILNFEKRQADAQHALFKKRQAEVHNALFEMTRASLSSSSSSEPRHLQEHLELCGDMFDNFYNEAQQFIDKTKEKGDE